MNLIELVRATLADHPPLRADQPPPAVAVEQLQVAAFELSGVQIAEDLARTLLGAYALLEPVPRL